MTSLSLSAPGTGSAAPRLATAVAFTLAFACGATGVLAFLDLGGVRTAGATVAVLAFTATLVAGLRLTGTHRPRLGTFAVGAAAVLVAAGAAAGPEDGARLLVIALAAAALGLQTAGARRITELAAAHGLAARPDGHLWTRIGSIPTLVTGAVAGVAAVTAAPAAALPISAAAGIAAVALVRRADLHRR